MKNDRKLETIFKEFIDQLAEKNKLKLIPFNQHRWFTGAYSTIQRTLHHSFSPLSDSAKAACAALIFSQIPFFSGSQFDSKLEELIKSIAKKFNISIGHSQKLVSIVIKYAVACSRQPEAQVPANLQTLVTSHFQHLPVPIDAIVLFQLKTEYPIEFGDVKARKGKDKKGRPTYSATINNEAWSRLSNYETYWSIQERIRRIANANNAAPLEFEMRDLWVKA